MPSTSNGAAERRKRKRGNGETNTGSLAASGAVSPPSEDRSEADVPAKTRQPTINNHTRPRPAPVVSSPRGEANRDEASLDEVTRDEGPSLESRSCENCRRGKLRCSRSYPCTRCLDKAVDCVYAQDKRRGPKPGYIEELYRRIDSLEQMVVGQSLLFQPPRESSGARDFPAELESSRHRLFEAGKRRGMPTQDDQSGENSHHRSESRRTPSPSGDDVRGPEPSDAEMRQMCETYRDHFQPWIPMFSTPLYFDTESTTGIVAARPAGHLLQAVTAAVGPFLDPTTSSRETQIHRIQTSLCEKIFQSADTQTLHACLIVEFLLLGEGRLTDYWGLVTYLPQVAMRAGLHLETQHLSSEQRDYRRLIKMLDDSDHDWRARESLRRLFWTVFLLDHFTAVLSGTRSSFDSVDIRRQLPCEGHRWANNEKVHCREFIQATVAVQVQITPDNSIGGLAYLIEATEILGLVCGFARDSSKARMAQTDPRGFLREFLSLDLVLANWKSRLPAHRQHASANKDGYMDHNVTLAHLTHNTSGIVLYQSPRALSQQMGDASQSSALGHVALIKPAAKEIARISTRFLLHRRYFVSPQFCYCQFVAARSLLAYASWMAEPLDEDFDTLLSSLSEASKRWNADLSPHEGDMSNNDGQAGSPNFADQLISRLRIDSARPESISLNASWTALSSDLGHGASETTQADPEGLANWMDPFDNSTLFAQASGSSSAPATDALLPSMPDPTKSAPYVNPLDGDLTSSALLSSLQFEGLGNRIFSWRDYEDLLNPPFNPGEQYPAS